MGERINLRMITATIIFIILYSDPNCNKTPTSKVTRNVLALARMWIIAKKGSTKTPFVGKDKSDQRAPAAIDKNMGERKNCITLEKAVVSLGCKVP